MCLEKKIAIVTGASSGIGRGILEVFDEQGAVVVNADRSDAGHAGSHYIKCDVSDEPSVAAMVAQTVEQFGRVDILVNNAGVNFVKPFDELTIDEWDRVIGVDLRGVFLCTRACIGHFIKQQGGSVVNIASVHARATLAGAAPYDAAKGGVVAMTRSLAVEYASRNIRFNCLSPGLIDTQIWTDIREAADDKDACDAHWWQNIPMARVGSPREIGKTAAFMASDDAAYMTGADIVVDGGMTSQLISKEAFASNPVGDSQ